MTQRGARARSDFGFGHLTSADGGLRAGFVLQKQDTPSPLSWFLRAFSEGGDENAWISEDMHRYSFNVRLASGLYTKFEGYKVLQQRAIQNALDMFPAGEIVVPTPWKQLPLLYQTANSHFDNIICVEKSSINLDMQKLSGSYSPN
jgi:hypothetical protein